MSIEKIPATTENLLKSIKQYWDDGFRLITATCIDEGEEFRVIYSFDKELAISNLEVVTPREKAIPSISGIYACAFLIENEMKELFSLKIDNLGLDLGGKMYLVDDAPAAPMARPIKQKTKGDE